VDKELKTALAAVRQASALCRFVQAGILTEVMEKSDRSPVTVADFGSQALVCRLLRESFPGDPVVAEEDSAELRRADNRTLLRSVVDHVGRHVEGADTASTCDWIDHGASGTPGRRFWTLDPIDGTKGFLRKGQYAIALALIVEGRVTLAVMGCPNLPVQPGTSAPSGAIFTAIAGHGSMVWPMEQNLSHGTIRTGGSSDPSAARFCESVESGHSSHGDSARVAEKLGIVSPPVRIDSQAKYAVVARGEAEIYMRLPTRPGYVERIWDHAAGSLVITEAGGTVTDITGKPLDFGQGAGLEKNRGIIATNGAMHSSVLDALRECGIR